MSKTETSNLNSIAEDSEVDEHRTPIRLQDWIENVSDGVRLERILAAIRQVLIHIDVLHGKRTIHGCLTLDAIQIWPATGEVRVCVDPTSKQDDLANGSSYHDACYLAPEQTGVLQRSLTPATDLYAIGMILYRLLTGDNPVSATSLNELLIRQMTWMPSSLRMKGLQIPRILDEMVLRLVKRNPHDRYQRTSAVLEDLDSVFHVLQSDGHHAGGAIGASDTRERLADPSFVGRSSWITDFVHRVESNADQYPRPWIIQGPIGQGKTRLLIEFENEAASRSMLVLRTTGTQGEHSQPLEAISTLLQELKGACEKTPSLTALLQRGLADHAESLQPLLPWLWDDRRGNQNQTGPESFAGRRLKQALQRLLSTLSRFDQRIVLLVDNLDRCDTISKGLFIDWVNAQQRNPHGHLFLVASMTVEPYELIQEAFDNPPDLLNPLSHHDVVQLLRSMAGDFPASALTLIADAARGNAYMAISLLYGMLESGTAVPSPSGWKIRSLSLESLQGLRMTANDLKQRIQSLNAECQRFLVAASVLGRNFRFEEARSLARLSVSEAQMGLEVATRRQLIWTDSNRNNISFLHDSVRQAFLEELAPRDCAALHLRSARMIQRHSLERCFELADHYDAAGYAEQAIEFALQAAKQSHLQYSYDYAIRYYGIALKWLPAQETQKAAETTEQLAEVYLSKSDYELALREFVKALNASNDQASRMRIKGKIGDVQFKRGNMKEAAAYYLEALALSGVRLPKTPSGMICYLLLQVIRQTLHSTFGLRTHRLEANPMQRMRWSVLSRLAHTYWFSRGPLWTLMAHLRGMNEAECYRNSRELAKAYSEHAPVCSLLGQFARANEYSQRSLQICIDLNDAWGQGQTLSYSSVVQLAATRFLKCESESRAAVELLQKAGDAWETNMARYQGANAIYRLGRYREAAEMAQQMHLSGIEIGDTQASGISLDILMRAAPSMVSEKTVEQQAAIERSDAQSHAQTQLALAIFRLRQGRISESVDILEGALKRCKLAGHLNTYISPCFVWLATARRLLFLSISRQNFPLLRQCSQRLRKAVRRSIHVARKYPADLPHAYREKALLHVLDGRLSQARQAFSRSLRYARDIDSSMEEYESLRCMMELASELGDQRYPISNEHRARFDLLHSDFAESIALNQVKQPGQASLSLVDRFDKLLDDGRRIAGSLNKEAIFKECCLAAQHLLRGQSVTLFEKTASDGQWSIADHRSSESTHCDVPQKAHYERCIHQTCDHGTAEIFSTEVHNGLTHGSLIAVPIRIRDVIVACLAVEHSEIENLFGEAELQVAEFIATLTGAALENAEGFASLRDLNTSLEQRVASRTEELRKAMAVAVAASQAKSQFLATMSHEVRTPLNGILGMTRLALAKCFDTQQTNYLSTIQRSGESLLQLLNDLLDFSKLEAGKMTIESIPFDPRQVLSDVIGLMSVSAWQKGLEVIANFDPQLPEQLLGDGVRFRQVVSNLLGNAIKFTSTGYIEVRVEATLAPESQPARWKVSVIDTGIGIPESKRSSIFEAFSQADGTTTRRFGGTGLGLSISVELVRLMQGTIELESEEGVGSKFSVVLPLNRCDHPATTQLHSCRLPGTRILILEPHPVARRSLERLLESWGATTVAIECWSELQDRKSIDLQLFDLAILCGPEANGLAKEARAVGVVTWLGASPDTLPGDLTSTLSKPLLPSDLVRQFVELAPRIQKPSSEPDASAKGFSLSEAKASSSSLRVLVAEDGEINRMVLVGLLELLGHSATVVEDGLQATQKANEETFDICLMDLDMPEMDGVEATRVIRLSGNPLTIYAMTAHHDEQHAILSREAGMNGYLTKPIQADQLKTILLEVAASKAGLPD